MPHWGPQGSPNRACTPPQWPPGPHPTELTRSCPEHIRQPSPPPTSPCQCRTQPRRAPTG
eukprot:8242312-Alexandrium_andersonii.AAC.1